MFSGVGLGFYTVFFSFKMDTKEKKEKNAKRKFSVQFYYYRVLNMKEKIRTENLATFRSKVFRPKMDQFGRKTK